MVTISEPEKAKGLIPPELMTELGGVWCITTPQKVSVLVVAENHVEALQKYNAIRRHRPQDVGQVNEYDVRRVLAVR